jgi:hypothetical protein
VRVSKITAGAHGAITLVLKLPGAGKLAIATTAKAPKAKKAITYAGRVAQSVKTAKTLTVRLKPGAAAAVALRRAKRLPVVVSVAFTPAGGKRATTTARVTAKR